MQLLAILSINIPRDGSTGTPTRATTATVLDLLSAVFGALVWWGSPTFGSRPECNASTVWVAFGVLVPVTSRGTRWIATASLSTATIRQLFTLGAALFRDQNDGFTATQTTTTTADGKVRTWAEFVAVILFDAVAITSLEQSIAENNLAPGRPYSTFGEVLGVAMLFNVIFSLWGSVRSWQHGTTG